MKTQISPLLLVRIIIHHEVEMGGRYYCVSRFDFDWPHFGTS